MTSKGATRRFADGLNLAGFLLGVVALAVVVNFFAQRPGLRIQADSTKTRAYSLSPQTELLLAGLEGEWTIAIVLAADSADRAVRRQVDEVLDRYRQASDRLSVVRVDPTDPRTLDAYEELLARLRSIYRDRIEQYEKALDEGRRAVEELTVFLQQQAGELRTLRRSLEEESPARGELDQVLGVFALSMPQAGQVLAELDEALEVSDLRPLADYEAARSVLAAALGGWANELYQVVQLFDGWKQRPELEALLRQLLSTRRDEYEWRAQQLALVADPLKFLEPLELAAIGRQLQRGEAGIVIGPRGARVIPSSQLFPALNLRGRGGGQVTFDQRFRGEQMISAAIRSLLVDHMPMVVFVHGQDQSMLGRRSQNVDLLGPAQILRAGRYEVAEWIVGQSEPPTPAARQPVVWVVVPPPIIEKRSLAPAEAELALIDAAAELVARGEPVLLSFCPSPFVRPGQPDPWQKVTAPLGIAVDSSRVVYERLRDQAGNAVNQRVLQVTDFEPGHAVATAVHGLQASFDLPLAVRSAEPAPPGVSHDVIAAIEPAENRWLERDWLRNPAALDGPDESQRFETALAIVVAGERIGAVEGGVPRFVVVGAGGWLLSYVADVVVAMGGQRVVLVNPGNYELLLAAVAWLAGHDELIAPSPVSRQVARLSGITPGVQVLWRWIAIVLAPGAWLALGTAVWFVRRR